MDYHIIFDKDLDNQTIKDLLIKIEADTGPEKKKLSKLTDKDDIKKAFINKEELVKILEADKDLNGRYLTAFLSRGHGNARSSIASIYESVAKSSDILIHSSCNNVTTCINKEECSHNNADQDREYWLNTNGEGSSYIKPLLQSSDAHSFEDIGSKYSWIKADLSFEGLKQVLYEPEDRISLEKEKPAPEKNEFIIDRIEYNLDGITRKIYLSEYMNAIIGGRSTGKSTLLNSIAMKLDEKAEDKYHISTDDFSIFWREGEGGNKTIKYIPQNHMHSIANEEKSFNKLIMEIVKSKELDQQITNYRDNIDKTRNEITTLLSKYESTIRAKNELVKPEPEKIATEKRIESYKQQRDSIQKKNSFTQEELEQLDEQRNTIGQKTTNLETLKSDIAELKNISLPKIVLDYQDLVNLSEYSRDKIDSIIDKLSISIKESFNNEISALQKTISNDITQFTDDVNKIKSKDQYKKYIELLDSNKEIKRIEDEITKEEKTLKTIINYERTKDELSKKETELKKIIIEEYKKFSMYRSSLADSFLISEEETGDIRISADFSLKNDLSMNIFNYINRSTNAGRNFIDSLEDGNKFNPDTIAENIFDDNNLKFNSNKDNLHHIRTFLTSDLYDQNFLVYYQSDDFKTMSPGKKAFVILKLLLDFSDSKVPVLIDQPEDSLDNRAIYSELTMYIKKAKKKRQIILVTHNPNIVVAGDCENVIVANQHSQYTPNKDAIKFDYKNGSLESYQNIDSDYTLEKKSIKEHVCEILEGGKEAFKTRENKYAFDSEKSS